MNGRYWDLEASSLFGTVVSKFLFRIKIRFNLIRVKKSKVDRTFGYTHIYELIKVIVVLKPTRVRPEEFLFINASPLALQIL